MSDPSSRVPALTIVQGARRTEDVGGRGPRPTQAAARDLEWSVLMARSQNGDGDAYGRLLQDVAPYLRSLAAHWHRDPSDAEDAVQDILLTIHAIRQTYDPTRPFGPWLVTIANRRLFDRIRRHGRVRSRETALAAEHEAFPGTQTNLDEEISDRRELEAALDHLPLGQQQAIRLLKLEELSLKEAAVVTGMSVSALKVATHRALKSLRKMLSRGSDNS